MADTIKKFTVNGRIYSLDAISPDAAFSFGLKTTKVIGPMIGGLQGIDLTTKDNQGKFFSLIAGAATGLDTDKAELLCKEALNYVITPENEYLKNPMVRNKCFTDHPEDLMMVPIMAVWELAKDFLLPALTSLGQNSKVNSKASA